MLALMQHGCDASLCHFAKLGGGWMDGMGGLEGWLFVFFLDVFTGNQVRCLGWGFTRCVFVILSVGVVEGVFWAPFFNTWRVSGVDARS